MGTWTIHKLKVNYFLFILKQATNFRNNPKLIV